MTDIIANSVFYEFTALLVLAAVAGLVGLALRQPLIVSFIAVGILAGPSTFHVAAPRNTSSCSPSSAWPCCCSWSG
jgi:Kef-type K+ transport system membrane component KefB